MVTLNWYNPGLTSAAATEVWVPPRKQAGVYGRDPVWVDEPATRGVAGRPKPTLQTEMISPRRAHVEAPGNSVVGPTMFPLAWVATASPLVEKSRIEGVASDRKTTKGALD